MLVCPFNTENERSVNVGLTFVVNIQFIEKNILQAIDTKMVNEGNVKTREASGKTEQGGTMEKFLVFILLVSDCVIGTNANYTVIEVQVDHLATLPCLSNDDNHRFMFWQLSDGQHVIGPGNLYDHNKYNYEVLTGKLIIQGISPNESGRYTCVSKGVQNHLSINVHVFELVVKTDMEDNFEKNLLRSMVAVSIIVVGIAVILLIITIKRKQSRTFFDLEDSPTREDSPAKFSRENQVPTIVGPSPLATQGIDNIGMDIDFPRVFTKMQKEQSLP